jgi:hypothetical protein
MKNIKNLELFWRGLITALFWLGLLLMIGAAALVSYWAGVVLPTVGYTLPLLFGLLVTFIIWNKYGWEVIKDEKMQFFQRQIEVKLVAQLQDLSDEELQKTLADIEQAKKEFGLIPADADENSPKTKRDAISERIKALSDSDLILVKNRLAQGTTDNDEIIQLLDTINTQHNRE